MIRAYEEQKGLRVWEGYGLTEIGPNNFMGNGKPGTFGNAMPGVDVKLVDDARPLRCRPAATARFCSRAPT